MKKIICEIIYLNRENEKIIDYRPWFFPWSWTMRYVTPTEWHKYNYNKRRISELKNKIYKKVWLWNYIIYIFNKTIFYKKFKII